MLFWVKANTESHFVATELPLALIRLNLILRPWISSGDSLEMSIIGDRKNSWQGVYRLGEPMGVTTILKHV